MAVCLVFTLIQELLLQRLLEYVQHNKIAKERNLHRLWSANEKTAMESALGMSYAGKRAMACMKHVGLNVAADPFVNSAITGANGGLIYTIADDPSMHSSQNEQDSRALAKFALIPILNPQISKKLMIWLILAFNFLKNIRYL
jgi:indolepyruvate ferredoxin oxidoreductase, alpha subunit